MYIFFCCFNLTLFLLFFFFFCSHSQRRGLQQSVKSTWIVSPVCWLMIHIVAGVFLRGSKFLFENSLIMRMLYFEQLNIVSLCIRCGLRSECVRGDLKDQWLWSFDMEQQCLSVEFLNPSNISREERRNVRFTY